MMRMKEDDEDDEDDVISGLTKCNSCTCNDIPTTYH